MKLGIDIGRVLISPDPANGGDTSFIGGSIEAALNTPPYPGMFEAVPELAQLFRGQVWLVSKPGPKMQEKSRLWLIHHRFFERTGIPPENLRFCLERRQKADHCRKLGLNWFIDDRPDVLQHLADMVPRRYLFGPQKENASVPNGAVPVLSWPAALTRIRADLSLAT